MWLHATAVMDDSEREKLIRPYTRRNNKKLAEIEENEPCGTLEDVIDDIFEGMD